MKKILSAIAFILLLTSQNISFGMEGQPSAAKKVKIEEHHYPTIQSIGQRPSQQSPYLQEFESAQQQLKHLQALAHQLRTNMQRTLEEQSRLEQRQLVLLQQQLAWEQSVTPNPAARLQQPEAVLQNMLLQQSTRSVEFAYTPTTLNLDLIANIQRELNKLGRLSQAQTNLADLLLKKTGTPDQQRAYNNMAKAFLNTVINTPHIDLAQKTRAQNILNQLDTEAPASPILATDDSGDSPVVNPLDTTPIARATQHDTPMTPIASAKSTEEE